MAQFFSDLALDFRRLDLNAQFQGLRQNQFANNANGSFSPSQLPGLVGTFAFEDLVAWWDSLLGFSQSRNSVAITGTSLTYSTDARLTGGYATGFLSVQDGYGLAVLGFRVGAAQIQSALSTQSTTDDLAVLNAVLVGADRVNGSVYGDFAYGRAGNDTLLGYGGNDTLMGDVGHDQLRGGSGSDRLFGGTGNDTIYGDAGTDQLIGGRGTDVMYGGADGARDVFVFTSRLESPNSTARDVIQNFTHNIDDISLFAMDANTAASGNQAFAWGGKTAGANAVWYTTAGGNATVFADVNGDRVADFSVRVSGVTALTASDFVL